MGEADVTDAAQGRESAAWQRVRAGDESALGDVFDLHQGRVFRHAFRLLGDHEDAKDAVAVAFFELWRRRGSVHVVDGSVLPWLLVAVANAARNLERSARRYRALLAKTPAERHVDAPSASDESGVLAALRKLPERERAVVVLAVLEGFSEREVAEALGIAPGTVKSRLSRAKAKLRDEMVEVEASWA
ncbi:RNA polymerase sigma factor [Microbacterium sp. SORGH_AS_0862]|uniref:RNA polymerase sigma factor n=1 Tax=Microbacterium sp. SORGH_AS_0862 TaxID=3041789 RepID=UPI00278D8FE1|nr:sigma-70 family RNA polymerase sigma factor [Microbacterium sp. SORGH_AS_0862]MDQ1204093.1 RNA polymerase sigma factor (sigma-70 family) [Microbacterium sp. SORGH_AS_0862]